MGTALPPEPEPLSPAGGRPAKPPRCGRGKQELVAASRLIDVLPSLVEAESRAIADSNLTILNGTQGVNEVLTGIISQGFIILDVLKRSTAALTTGTDGTAVNGDEPEPARAGSLR